MLGRIRSSAIRNLVNIRGWRTNRKIVVIESDDWGSMRMPSKEAYEKLLQKGIRVDQSLFDKYDTLEQREDLEHLFNTLISYKDKNGNHPIFTFNTVMGNPAFERIEEDQFEEYYREDLFTSYKRYNQDDIADLWYRAMETDLIRPQFHAREHLNVSLWMKALRNNHSETVTAFNHRFFGLKTQTPSSEQRHYLAAYWAEDECDYTNKINILEDGLEIFRKKFSFTSESFIACNYVLPVSMEKPLSDLGIKYIQTQRGHIAPDISTGNIGIDRHFTGQATNFKQLYLVRNCFFEPTLDQDTDSVNRCLKEIKAAFRWNKPAILSSHRINYVGGMTTANRNRGLEQLSELLKKVLKRWPEVEFLSSDKLGSLIAGH